MSHMAKRASARSTTLGDLKLSVGERMGGGSHAPTPDRCPRSASQVTLGQKTMLPSRFDELPPRASMFVGRSTELSRLSVALEEAARASPGSSTSRDRPGLAKRPLSTTS